MKDAKSKSVEGVLNGPPAGVGGNKRWTFVFELVPWRIDGSTDLCDVPLRVEIPVSERELDRWMDRLNDGNRVEVAVRRLSRPAGKPWWLATARFPVRRTAGSALLRRAQAERAKPVVIEDSELGRLVLDRSLYWFEGKRRFGGRSYRISVMQSGAGENRTRDLRDVERGKAIILELEARHSATLAAIAREMLPLYNDNWRDRRKRLKPGPFLERIRLSDIVIHSDGAATMYFKDGGLFLGHTIEVRVRGRRKISEICLSG
jgi:hypothetical protein